MEWSAVTGVGGSTGSLGGGVTVLKSYRQSSKHGPVWRVNAEVGLDGVTWSLGWVGWMATDANQCRSFWCLQFSVSSEGAQEHSRTPASQFGPFLCICSLETPHGRTLWEAHGPRGPSYGAFWQVGLTSGFCSVVPTLALVLHCRVKEGPQARRWGVGRGERQPLHVAMEGVDTAPGREELSANLGLELSS